MLPQVTRDPRYYSKPLDLLDDTCYFQKFIEDDVTYLQVLLDPLLVTDLALELFDVYTDALVHTYTFVDTLKTTEYEGITYEVWQAELAFTGITAGKYYLQLSYFDDTQTQILQSPIEVGDFPDTLLIEYRNSLNKFSIIFDTDIVFNLRVEGIIKDYVPQFEDTTYNDEIHEQTLLDSVYFDQLKLYVPGLQGYIPAYMAKRVNIALGCDTVLIDGEYYARLEGAKWDVQHAPEDDRMGISIDIVPTTNNTNVRLITGGQTPQGNFQNVRRSKEYLLQSADFQISGIFGAMTHFDSLVIYNTNNTAFTLRVGQTVGGSELGEFVIDPAQDDNTIDIGASFKTDEIVYISGLTGVAGLSLDIYAVYDVLNAPLITLPFSATDTIGKGATIRYKEIMPGDLPMAFDLVSGLGIVGSKWEKWALADGRNGGVDESGCVAVMYDPTNPDYDALKIDTTGGADSITLSTAQLPNFYLQMFGNTQNPAGGDKPNAAQRVAITSNTGTSLGYELKRNLVDSDTGMIGRTSSIGSGAEIDARMKYIVGITIIKIAD